MKTIYTYIYSLDFDEFAVEERFAFADLDDGYGLIVVVDHAQRQRFQFEARVRLRGTLGARGRANDGHQNGVHRPPSTRPSHRRRFRSLVVVDGHNKNTTHTDKTVTT